MREPGHQRAFRLDWSNWRRAHQAVAARCQAVRQARRQEGPGPRPGAVLPPAGKGETLSDADWERIRPLLPPQKPSTGRPRHDHRVVLNGILSVVRSGASWREMPAEYGKWETAYKRYRLWYAEGRWQRLLEALGPGTIAGDHSTDSGP